jgi:hypothetical protein
MFVEADSLGYLALASVVCALVCVIQAFRGCKRTLLESDFPTEWGNAVPDNAFVGHEDAVFGWLVVPERFCSIGAHAFDGCQWPVTRVASTMW